MADPDAGSIGKTASPSRMSVLVGGRHVFRCAACGKDAASIGLVVGDVPVEFGPGPDGRPLVVTVGNPEETRVTLSFLGIMSMIAPAEAIPILEASEVDPLSLVRLNWELGAFCCRECHLNYCSGCWRHWPVFADDSPGWHEGTRGLCPNGHEQRLDD